jgi:cytosolic carboxypeptidase protein 2/3
LKTYYKPESPQDTTLVFESRFESGNLRRAVKVGETEYDLILKYDYGTTVYTQWYYFKVSNVKRGLTYKFNIINLVKPDSSYNQG